MKPSIVSGFSAVLLSLLAASAVLAAQPQATAPRPEPGAETPFEGVGHLRLPVPEADAHKTYLGVGGAETFAVSDIQARVLVIEVFSMYCPHCQREAPKVNDLFRRISEDPVLNGAIKMIGIGVGNSAYEIEVFRKQYDVPFPLFPDPDMTLSKRLGAERTPTFIAFSRHEGAEFRQFLFKAGDFGDPESFLDTIVSTSDVALTSNP